MMTARVHRGPERHLELGDDVVIKELRAAAAEEFAKLAGCWVLADYVDEDERAIAIARRRGDEVLMALFTLRRLADRLAGNASDLWPRGLALDACPFVRLAKELAEAERAAARAANVVRPVRVQPRRPREAPLQERP